MFRDLMNEKVALIEAAKEKRKALKLEIEVIEAEMGEALKAEGWKHHDSIADYGYGECWGWSGWLHPSVPLDPNDADAPDDESLMYLYKYASCDFTIN